MAGIISRSRTLGIGLLFGLAPFLLSTSPAAELPRTIESAPCGQPPVIDGVLGEGEWNHATTLKFDLPMVQLKPFALKEKRPCELRIMNSGNALYLALVVPNAASHKSLSPIDIDMAALVFCQGKELARGDDRKVLAPGIYIDKHVTDPGRDEDDAQQDGRGTVAYADGLYTFEWAVPLDPHDANDLHAKPGDQVRFNIAFFDRFSMDQAQTQAGGLFGADLNKATEWGTLHLANNVKDDDGSAFRGPAWIGATLGKPDKPPANRLHIVSGGLITGQNVPIGRAEVTYTYLDPNGVETPAKAKIYLPASVQKEGVKLPLIYSAGYELDDASAVGLAQRGYAVATPASLTSLPLVRTANPDIALLHIVRALPFVDDSRVIVTGTSAGGWMTFMLAAETFPLAGAAPDVAPMNWGYNAAYLVKQRQLLTPKVPALFGIGPMVEPCLRVYGPDTDDETWFRNSPLAHIATITCPVSTFWTTADMLVPMNQIGDRWVQPFDAKQYPDGFSMDRAKLAKSIESRLRLMDVLPESACEVFVVPMPEGAVKRSVSQAENQRKTIELPVSATKQWSIAILDEGQPEPHVDHLKFNLRWTREAFYKQALTGRIAPEQLTATKLQQMMDRYAGREWLPTSLKRLDQPDSEKADVLRGLHTYVKASTENVRTFARLYAELPAERQALPADVVQQLAQGK